MTFLTPLFLIALAGLAVPVLLHLIQRERKQVVQFPSLMFLRRIPYQSVRRRRIRHWLLLMMRLAALALIVLAFARPFFRGADPVRVGGGWRSRGGDPRRSLVQHGLRRPLEPGTGGGPRRRRRVERRRSRVDRLLRIDAGRRPALDVGQGTAAIGAGRRAALGRCDALWPGAQARRQHPRANRRCRAARWC